LSDFGDNEGRLKDIFYGWMSDCKIERLAHHVIILGFLVIGYLYGALG
jgi:hypothetical protein